MKKITMHKSIRITLTLIILASFQLNAQKNEWLNQVITVNSGKYETTPPFVDYVTVQTYNPVNHQTLIFDRIYTQSAQDVVIKGDYAYVAAGDSLIMYNINNHQRVVAKSDSGINKLYVYNNRLIVSKQWPIKRFFVEVLDATDLSLVARIQNISGDCAGIVADGDSIYIAVPGGFGTTVGKIAVLSTNPWSLVREINLGTDALGIWNLYNFNGHIFSVNRTLIGGNPIGSISRYTLYTYTYLNKVFNVTLGDGIGIYNNLLYVNMNNGIGTINLSNLLIADTALIPDLGFVNRIFITSGGIEYVNGDIFLNIGNRINFGVCVQYTSSGDSISSYVTGINADALAFDYRTPVGIDNVSEKINLEFYPNPVRDDVWISIPGNISMTDIEISDLMGKSCIREQVNGKNLISISCTDLKPGIYFITVWTSQGKCTKKFVKH